MTQYSRLLAVAVLATVVAFQIGCDRNEGIADSTSPSVVGKGGAFDDLGARLKADPDFRELRKLLHDADRKARTKYFEGENVKRDLAFAKIAERKGELSASDRSRLSEIRGLSEAEFERVFELRSAIVSRFPELLDLTEQELQDVLASAGIGSSQKKAGKTLDKCSDCSYAYNSCIQSAEFRHAIEVMSCALLIQTVFGGTVCYLASASKYMWTITSCSQTKQYCLSGNGCFNVAPKDTL